MPISLLVRRKPGTDDLPLPRYMSEAAAGMDVCAAVAAALVLAPGDHCLLILARRTALATHGPRTIGLPVN